MPIPDKPSYSHGSTGTEPDTAKDYDNGDSVDADHFDHFVYTPFKKIKDIIDFLNTLDSDGDGKVDAADSADEATNAQQVKGNDIDSDGDGKVDSADVADNAKSLGGNQPSHYATASNLSDHESAGNPHDGSAGENVGVENPVYASTSDVPSSIGKGETVFIDGEGLYVEDGT